MTRFAIITIELPLDGGELEDAKVLAKVVAERGISCTIREECGNPYQIKPVGQVVDVAIEDRPEGSMGRARAQAMLRAIDADDGPWEDEDPRHYAHRKGDDDA